MPWISRTLSHRNNILWGSQPLLSSTVIPVSPWGWGHWTQALLRQALCLLAVTSSTGQWSIHCLPEDSMDEGGIHRSSLVSYYFSVGFCLKTTKSSYSGLEMVHFVETHFPLCQQSSLSLDLEGKWPNISLNSCNLFFLTIKAWLFRQLSFLLTPPGKWTSAYTS